MELAIERAAPESSEERASFVAEAEAALQAPDFAAALRFAESQKGERDVVKRRLAFFAQHVSEKARERAASAPHEAERWALRHAQVLDTLQDLERNVQPALALEAMLLKMRER
jgi:hypothetical protein